MSNAISGLLGIFRPAKPSDTRVTDPDEIAGQYRYWQLRVLMSTIVGYAVFYFVRKNISIAMPFMEADGINKSQLGLFLTLHGLLYGVSKFANGYLSDRSSSRAFLTVGLAMSAVITREGKISGVEVLGDGRDRRQVAQLVNEISRGRHEPARYGTDPIAVNLVWWVEHMTVSPVKRAARVVGS